MATTMNSNCPICHKKCFHHEKIAKCSLCLMFSHIRCLPLYNDMDIEYAQNENNNWSCTGCLKNIFPFFKTETNNELKSCFNPSYNNFDINRANEMIFDPFEQMKIMIMKTI